MRVVGGLVLLLVLAGCGSTAPRLERGLPTVVVRSPSAAAWVRLLRSSGWSVHGGTVDDLVARTSGVVPADAALSSRDRDRIVTWVRRGGRLATADATLLDRLGVKRGPPARVAGVTSEGVRAVWPTALSLRPLEAVDPLATADGGRAIMGSTRVGSGTLVGLAVEPVGRARAGHELLPTIAALTGTRLGSPAGPKSLGAHVFVDPGGAPGSTPASIAAQAALAGASVAEVAGWNYDFNDPANDYPYAKLIDALHARGILAYLWLEPPLVTLRLWQDHPECREKTESGRDAHVDWRSLIALEDPRCFQLATASWSRVVTGNAWDGVNVAELYFEPPIDAEHYTPFSKAALRQFGGDPKTDPEGFARFRTDLVTELNRRLLAFLNGLPGAKHRSLELTVIDDLLDPAQRVAVGTDVRRLAAVAKRAGASLIVEDPFTTWSEGPLRYDTLAPHVAALMPAGDAMLDVNVVNRAGARPTSKMTGAELTLALGAAGAARGAVAIYSLATVAPRDVRAIPGALASSVATTDLGTFGSQTILITTPAADHKRLSVDGIEWPAADGRAVIPPGNHVFTWYTGPRAGPGLRSLTGQLGTARVTRHTMQLTYFGQADVLAVLTDRPSQLHVDGAPSRLAVDADPDGGFAVRLPRGRHVAWLAF